MRSIVVTYRVVIDRKEFGSSEVDDPISPKLDPNRSTNRDFNGGVSASD